MPKRTAPVIVAYPGALQSSVLGLTDILSHAGLEPITVAKEGDIPARAAAIILPPAAEPPEPTGSPWIGQWLQRCSANGVPICSACVGVVWVAAAGVDAGRPVTTHWGIVAEIRKSWPDLAVETDRLVIEYSDLVTAGGLMAWIDLALIVIERLVGHQAMLSTARHFVVDPGRRDQRRFQRFQPVTDHGDAKILRAQAILECDLRSSLPVAKIAGQLGLSPRSLQRRFSAATGLSLTDYLQKLRIEQAKTLLADTETSVANVALDVGYTDVPAFHRVFLRHAGQPPARFRRSMKGGKR
ncbi:MAG: helix-turn-helix domain-containing protein [Pseudomonadota bacterium]